MVLAFNKTADSVATCVADAGVECAVSANENTPGKTLGDAGVTSQVRSVALLGAIDDGVTAMMAARRVQQAKVCACKHTIRLGGHGSAGLASEVFSIAQLARLHDPIVALGRSATREVEGEAVGGAGEISSPVSVGLAGLTVELFAVADLGALYLAVAAGVAA